MVGGEAGQNWENIGWRVKVKFTSLLHQIRPKDHIEILRSLLPSKYSPLQADGNGLQGIYLTEVAQHLAEVRGGHGCAASSVGSNSSFLQ